jgi:hypothetical protein
MKVLAATALLLLLYGSTRARATARMLGAATPSDDGSEAVDTRVGTGVKGKDLINEGHAFRVAPGDKLWVCTRIVGVPPNSKITFRFMRGQTIKHEYDDIIPRVPWRTKAYKTFSARDGGAWTVRIVTPNRRARSRSKKEATDPIGEEDERELSRVDFQVTVDAARVAMPDCSRMLAACGLGGMWRAAVAGRGLGDRH